MKPLFVCMSVLLISGCGSPYTPVEPTAEQAAMKKDLARLRDDFKRAYASSQDYALVAILERDRKFDWMDKPEPFTRLLILQREQLDLDDYSFSEPGKEAAEVGQLEGVLGEYFWVTKEGEILFDDMDQPPGTEMVVEWFLPSNVSEASMHFCGNPCLKISLK